MFNDTILLLSYDVSCQFVSLLLNELSKNSIICKIIKHADYTIVIGLVNINDGSNKYRNTILQSDLKVKAKLQFTKG